MPYTIKLGILCVFILAYLFITGYSCNFSYNQTFVSLLFVEAFFSILEITCANLSQRTFIEKIAFCIVCLIPFVSIVTSIGCQARGSGVQIYDINDPKVVKKIKNPEGSGEYGIQSLVLSVDGTLLFCGCDSGSLVFFGLACFAFFD